MRQAIRNENDIKKLLKLQKIDEQLQVITNEKGDLPQAINHLQKKKETLQQDFNNIKKRIEDHKQALATQQNCVKEGKKAVKEYEIQKKETTTEQELQHLIKDIEIEKLDVTISQKKVKEHNQTIAIEESKLTEIETELTTTNTLLEGKQVELDGIMKNKEAKEQELLAERKENLQGINPTLYQRYQAIFAHKKPAIVNIVNHACNGCFIIVPLQKESNIKDREKMFFCENCSRLFAYVETPLEPSTKKKRRATKSK